jgi:site-specific DNA-methyltransferase (adenine-specific)
MNNVKLWNADCLQAMQFIPDKSIDLVITDPPYDIETNGAGMYNNPDKQYVQGLSKIKDGFDNSALKEVCRIQKRINCYFFCSQKQIIPYLDFFVREKNCNYNILSWHKTNPVPACGNKYLTDTEFILFFREKGVKIFGSYETKKTWYATPLNQTDKKRYGHPTPKPVDILTNFIANSSQIGETVLDPFMGSGSTGVACVNTGRNFIGIELDPQYFATAKQRIEEAQRT